MRGYIKGKNLEKKKDYVNAGLAPEVSLFIEFVYTIILFIEKRINSIIVNGYIFV